MEHLFWAGSSGHLPSPSHTLTHSPRIPTNLSAPAAPPSHHTQPLLSVVWVSLTAATTVHYPTEQLFLWDPGTASPRPLLDITQYHPALLQLPLFPT